MLQEKEIWTSFSQEDRCKIWKKHTQPISGRADRASATEAVDLGSIPGRVKPQRL